MASERDEDSHVRLLRLIGEEANLTQRELAARLGISLGKVNYLLRALAAKGALKADNFRKSGNKAAYAYALTPAGLAEKARLTRTFIARKAEEYETLRAEIEKMRGEVDAQSKSGRGDSDDRNSDA